jgi:predicted enzyme related to lactoylglutathione lyase
MVKSARDFDLRLAVVFTQLANPEPLHAFYHDILGFPVTKKVGHNWTEYGSAEGGTNIGVHRAEEMEPGDDPQTLLSFEVRNLDNLRGHLVEAGVKCSEVIERERGRFFMCCDPAGSTLHFIEFNQSWRLEHSY